jgi:dihydroneopterin aldolase
VTDTIHIDGLKVQTHIGVSDEERASPQPVVIDISIAADTRLAGMSDDLADTGDYAAVIRRVSEEIGGGDFLLIERLAERVAALVLQETEAISVKVEIIKEAPPVDEDVRAVSVTIERESE